MTFLAYLLFIIPTLMWAGILVLGLRYSWKEYMGSKEDLVALENSKNGRRVVAYESYKSSKRILFSQVGLLCLFFVSVSSSYLLGTYLPPYDVPAMLRVIFAPIIFITIQLFLVSDVRSRYRTRVRLREIYIKSKEN